MQKHNDNTIKTSGHSLEKYTSHFIRKGSKGLWKVLLCERWVRDWIELQHIDPPPATLLAITAFFSRSPGLLNCGPGKPASAVTWFSFQHLLSNWTSYHRGYIIIWRPPTSCERHICTQFNLSTVKVIHWYLWLDAPVIYTGAFLILTARPGANM